MLAETRCGRRATHRRLTKTSRTVAKEGSRALVRQVKPLGPLSPPTLIRRHRHLRLRGTMHIESPFAPEPRLEHHSALYSRVPPLCALALIVLLTALPQGGVSAQTPDDPPISLELAQQVFDSVWSQVANAHYDPDMGGIDWEAARDDLRPTSDESFTRSELRLRVQTLLGRIGESHYSVIPGESWDRAAALASDGADPTDAEEGRTSGDPLGVQVRLYGKDIIVAGVTPGSVALEAGVRPGWRVIRLGDNQVAARMAEFAEEEIDARTALILESGLQDQFMNPRADHPLELVLEDGSGTLHTFELTPSDAGNVPRQGFGTILPPLAFEFTHRRLPVEEGCVGIISWSVWLIPLTARFQEAMDDLEDCRGIILDLRGNLGGIVGTMSRVGGRFVTDVGVLGTLTTRDSDLRIQAEPVRVTMAGDPVTPFGGPLAIVVDGLSMSASELFASGMQALERGKVFGSPTPGMALPARTVPLPGGDYLMFAFADWVDSAGRRIEGVGVTPDVLVPMDRDALLEGRDPPVEAALAWILESEPYRHRP